MANVKSGQLAVIVAPIANEENLGKVVRVLRRVNKGDVYPDNGAPPALRKGEIHWWIQSQGSYIAAISTKTGRKRGVAIAHARDISLRPLLDNEGEDEMLRIAGKPREKEKQ